MNAPPPRPPMSANGSLLAVKKATSQASTPKKVKRAPPRRGLPFSHFFAKSFLISLFFSRYLYNITYSTIPKHLYISMRIVVYTNNHSLKTSVFQRGTEEHKPRSQADKKRTVIPKKLFFLIRIGSSLFLSLKKIKGKN